MATAATSALTVVPPKRVLVLLSHVDHGKTTLCDALLSQLCGSMSRSSVGECRVLDDREEERRRGITIYNGYMYSKAAGVGVMDSPGHADFHGEVLECLDLADGAVVIVDVNEGVLCRTIASLRTLRRARMGKIGLFVNKVDACMDQHGWEMRVKRILETFKAAVEGMENAERAESDLGDAATATASYCKIRNMEVVLGSAKGGWGVTLLDLVEKVLGYGGHPPGSYRAVARMVYEGKADIRVEEGKVKVYKRGEGGWDLVKRYIDLVRNFVEDREGQSMADIYAALALSLPELTHSSEHQRVQAAIKKEGKSKSISVDSVLSLIFPISASFVSLAERAVKEPERELKDATMGGVLRLGRTRVRVEGGRRRLVTMARVLGGDFDLSEADSWFLTRSKEGSYGDKCDGVSEGEGEGDAEGGHCSVEEVKISSLQYTYDGVRTKEVTRLPAGSVCHVIVESAQEGQGWDEEWVGNDVVCSFGIISQVKGIRALQALGRSLERSNRSITVTISPEDQANRQHFSRGVERIHRLEPNVEVTLTSKGEVALSCGGEVEMENLIYEIERVYMEKGVKVRVGERVLSFREGVDWFEDELDRVKAIGDKHGQQGRASSALGQMQIKAFKDRVSWTAEAGWLVDSGCVTLILGGARVSVRVFPRLLDAYCGVEGGEDDQDRKRREGELEEIERITGGKLWESEESNAALGVGDDDQWGNVKAWALAGFRAACKAGPVSEEPLHGVIVLFEGIWGHEEAEGAEMGGNAVSEITKAIKLAVLTRPVRIIEAFVRCDFQSTLSKTGDVYSTISKRRGKVLVEDVVEGTDLITITAVVPMVETMGLTAELLKRTSGESTAPMMTFNHWEKLPEDPFWQPTTAEEREDHGEGLLKMGGNNAGRLLSNIRRRKGLPAIFHEDKLIIAPDKQRNMKTKK